MTFEWVLRPFSLFLPVFEPFLNQLRVQMAQNRAENGSKCVILGDFGPFLGRFGVTLGSLWGHFRIVLISFRGRFELAFDLILGSFWAVFLGRFLALWVFVRSFCGFLVV